MGVALEAGARGGADTVIGEMSVKELVRRHWPVAAAIVLLLALVVGESVFVFRANDGRLVYAQDDAYIHMAVARNFAEHGVWGVTPHGFTSSSSSILWTLLLAFFYWLGGPNEGTPLILNVAFAVGALIVVGHWLLWAGVRVWARVLVLAAVVIAAPMAAVVFCGMEHCLHAFASVLFAGVLCRVLAGQEVGGREAAMLVGGAALVTLSRYEGLFLIAMACLVLFLERRRGLAAWVVVGGAAPLAVFGVISVMQGWYALPNSVLLKGVTPGFGSLEGVLNALGMQSIRQLFAAPAVLVLILSAAALLAIGSAKKDTGSNEGGAEHGVRPLLLVFIGTTLLHLQFAKISPFFRYEAYLVCLGLMVVGMSLALWYRSPTLSWYGYAGAAVAAVVLVSPLLVRGVDALRMTVPGTQNIYQQQYQMARFLRAYYPDGRVALNDIGAVSYMTDVHLVDLSGLADMDVARARRAGRYNQKALRRVTKHNGTQVALVYDAWFGKSIPEEWIEVARWKILGNVVCGSDTVSFYAVDPAEGERLAANLREFAPKLPREVAYRFVGEP